MELFLLGAQGRQKDVFVAMKVPCSTPVNRGPLFPTCRHANSADARFCDALQRACGAAGLTRVWSGFKNTCVKAEPVASAGRLVRTRSWGCRSTQASRERSSPPFARADGGQVPNGLCVRRTSGSLWGVGLTDSRGGCGERHLLPGLKLGVGGKMIFADGLTSCPEECQGQSQH